MEYNNLNYILNDLHNIFIDIRKKNISIKEYNKLIKLVINKVKEFYIIFHSYIKFTDDITKLFDIPKDSIGSGAFGKVYKLIPSG